MTTDWIVGVDGSPDGCAALNWAVHLAEQREEHVTPMSAWHVPLALTLMAGRRAFDVDRLGLEAEAEILVTETVGATADPSGVLLAPVVVEGHPAPVLLGAGRDGACVVVGRRGISDLKHRMLGSVSQYLATHARSPVVVVPAHWRARRCERIVVGFDGSEYAAAAMRWALDIAPEGATVTALMAIDIIPWLRPELVAERYPEELAAGQRRILSALDEVDPDGRSERTLVVHSAQQALAETSADADLLVVGPRGIGSVGRTILGSITTWLLHEAPCPVAVVPSPA